MIETASYEHLVDELKGFCSLTDSMRREIERLREENKRLKLENFVMKGVLAGKNEQAEAQAMTSRTRLVICKTDAALEHLKKEYCEIGSLSERGLPMEQGDTMVARDSLLTAGFEFGEDFYIRKV